MRCPYCRSSVGRCATTTSGRSITECTSCGRVVEERKSQSHHLFHIRAQDSPLCLVTSDLPALPIPATPSPASDDEDPFESSGFITAFSTWSLEPYPVFAQSSISFAGHLAELERVLEATSSSTTSSSSSGSNSSGPSVVVDNLRAYLQIIDVASILGLDCDISDHAFQLFRDCSSATCLRNRSVEALATAALVQAIREAQEPRTLQEISIAANLPQKEIGKYIKILGEALQLSQPINSNSISVHMPRFCTLLQLNKSAQFEAAHKSFVLSHGILQSVNSVLYAIGNVFDHYPLLAITLFQELATHIGEVVINKCFCTRRNPISISAAAIYLACQLEDKRKTQAEICKVTGLTEVTLRKVYKELLENWDDLLPSNYSPVVPPEKAFPTASIASGRSSTSRVDLTEAPTAASESDKQLENKVIKPGETLDAAHQSRGTEETENKDSIYSSHSLPQHTSPYFWKSQVPVGSAVVGTATDKIQNATQEMDIDPKSHIPVGRQIGSDEISIASSVRSVQFSTIASSTTSLSWPLQSSAHSGYSPSTQFLNPGKVTSSSFGQKSHQNENGKANQCFDM